jgi:hypothetical protein
VDEYARDRKATTEPVAPEEPGGAALESAAKSGGVAGVTGAAALAGVEITEEEIREAATEAPAERVMALEPAPELETAAGPTAPPTRRRGSSQTE